MSCPHTHFDRGQRIRIVLKDGRVLIRRFVERRGRSIQVVVIDSGLHEEIATSNLRAVSIFKQRC